MLTGTTYQQLNIFSTIATEGSITNAAKRLEMSSPSVSNALKQLEQQLGVPLFVRTTRKIELTEAGKHLLQLITQPITALNNAIDSISELSEKPSGKLRLTTPRFVYQLLLKPIYMEFCQRYPDIQFEISVSDATINLLDEGFDLGLRFGDKVDPGMIARQITPPIKEAVFASPDYIKRHGMPTNIEALQQHKFIQYRFISSNQLAPLLLTHQNQIHRVEMPTALIVNDTDLVIDAAIKGLGVSKLANMIVAPYFERQQLVPIMPDYWHTYSGIFVYFHQNTQKAKRLRVFIDFLLEKLVAPTR